MKIIGAMFNKISGPDAVSSYSIKFSIDESQRDGILDLAKDLKKGSEVLLMIFKTENKEDMQEINDLKDETQDQTKKRMFKRMHALINKVAKDKNVAPKKIKETLREFLIKKSCMKESSKELDIKGLAMAIFFLENEFKN